MEINQRKSTTLQMKLCKLASGIKERKRYKTSKALVHLTNYSAFRAKMYFVHKNSSAHEFNMIFR